MEGRIGGITRVRVVVFPKFDKFSKVRFGWTKMTWQ